MWLGHCICKCWFLSNCGQFTFDILHHLRVGICFCACPVPGVCIWLCAMCVFVLGGCDGVPGPCIQACIQAWCPWMTCAHIV